jgi:hypothetical protein
MIPFHNTLPSGGPDGELAASMRYLSQRYTMPNRVCMGMLTDIGISAPVMFLLYQEIPQDKQARQNIHRHTYFLFFRLSGQQINHHV